MRGSIWTTRGSPPRMRGKEIDRFGFLCGLGITPAYAGKRVFRLFDCCGHGDHPRVCGEKLGTFTRSDALPGSPPRMRGKVTCRSGLKCLRGITPAYAGKRRKEESPGNRAKDHPRVCGEKRCRIPCYSSCLGSPPRMRGKEAELHHAGQLEGITPAYAGKSSGVSRWSEIHEDHPRVCGEKTKKIP